MAEQQGQAAGIDRIYQLLPEHIRSSDFHQGLPLQTLMRILTAELQRVEQDISDLYENWFVETAEQQLLPYIGDLLAIGRLHPIDDSGMLRAYVANTLNYRRGKGTTRVLENVASDVTGWPIYALEFFHRMVQSQQLNHAKPENFATVDLKVSQAQLHADAFNKLNHLVDVRSAEKGRYNIRNIGLFIWRLQSYRVGFLSREGNYCGGVQPRESIFGSGLRHLNPLGSDMTLFNRQTAELSANAANRHLPTQLLYRSLDDDLSRLRANPEAEEGGEYFRHLAVFAVRLAGQRLAAEKLHVCQLQVEQTAGETSWHRPARAGEVLFDPELGRISLHPDDENAPVEVAYNYGFVDDLGAGSYDRRSSFNRWFSRFEAIDFAIGVSQRSEHWSQSSQGWVVASLSEAFEAWNQLVAQNSVASGVIVLMDSGSYSQPLPIVDIPQGAQLAVVAAGWPLSNSSDQQRDLAALSPRDRRPHIVSDLQLKGGGEASRCILDGLLLEGGCQVLSGQLHTLEIYHSSIGANATGLASGIIVSSGTEGDNSLLQGKLESSIIGEVDVASSTSTWSFYRSILGELIAGEQGQFKAANSDLAFDQCSVFLSVEGRSLQASNSIFVHPLNIQRRQQGCARFCFIPPGSTTPRRYRCAVDLMLEREQQRLNRPLTALEQQLLERKIQPQFSATHYHSACFAQLADSCVDAIAQGGEGGAAMGAYYRLGEPFRHANLQRALEEYLPLGLEAGVIYVN